MFLLQLVELVDKSLYHGFSTICFVIFSCFTQSVLNDVSIIIVESDVVLENISSSFSGKNIKDGQLAVAGEEVSSLVKFLNLLMIINVLVIVVNEHVDLDEDVEEPRHASVRVEGEGGEGSLTWATATVTKHNQKITN